MSIKNIFKVSALATAIILTGCGGGDINITPTTIDNSVDNSDNSNNSVSSTIDGVSTENVCASYTNDAGTLVQGTVDGIDCLYSDDFSSRTIEIVSDLTFSPLDNGGVHVVDGAILMGEDCDTETGTCTIDTNGPTLTVEAGTTLAFTSGEAIIRIGRGAQIQAVGTLDEPVVFTSSNAFERLDVVGEGPLYADWGGIIINGLGVTNQCTNVQRTDGTCNISSEGVTSFFGGNDNTDSSGSIEFANIFYAGSGPAAGAESGDDLNSLTLNAVGSGSTFDFIHIHQGFDDGIEFFGGAADITHIVVTDTQDDSIDIDGGWQGNAQFLFLQHGTVTLANGSTAFLGNHGLETDGEQNGGDAFSDAPASNPTISNVTVITTNGLSVRDDDPSRAVSFDDNIQSTYYNTLFVQADNSTTQAGCIRHTTDGEESVQLITFNNSVTACVSEFDGGDTFATAPAQALFSSKQDWYDAAGTSARIAANSTVLLANGFSTDNGSADLATVTAIDPTTITTANFEAGTYLGAVSEDDTTSQWFQFVEAAVAVANAD